ncbi:MAG: hypothetical protein Q8P57_03075 [Candidatus Pacearchaeota archaeon]|nr:hypothetical protein [Candidatus Pacearchaeota archaeon]
MSEEELKKESARSIGEMNLAWKEFFKNKPEPKTEEEDKKQQEEFYNWYNYIRKQSDTGKTPAEMYKEVYGKEPPSNLLLNSQEPSRMMDFEWDKDYEEDYFEEDEEKRNEELIKIAEEAFEKGVWQKSKVHLKEMSKRDVARHMFTLGFLAHEDYIDFQFTNLNNKLKDMPPKEVEKMFKDFRKDEGDEK